MIAVATGGPHIQDKEAEYVSLYQQVDAGLRRLQARGLNFANPNTFRSLWDWYGYWNKSLSRYQQRRDYVNHLYDAVLMPFESALAQQNDTPKTSGDLASSVRLGLYEHSIAVSTEIPTEIWDSLRRFEADHANPLKTAFIMMRFGQTKAHQEIAAAIRSTLSLYGIEGVRADDKQYHDDLFPNILTYMHGCGFGIAVFERIEADEFNPNVSLELGYMMALRKSVCLLKDKTLKTLLADLVGKLYRLFDPFDISQSINEELSQWIQDRGFAS